MIQTDRLIRFICKLSANISKYLSNIREYEFLTGKDVLTENELLEKAITLKRFEYFLLGKELKSQTDISKRKYKGLDKIFISYRDNNNVNKSLIKKEKII